ncbi:hypothetical protein P3S67_032116 [Capsicum chacoense]
MVAVRHRRKYPKQLLWSLTHVVQPGDCITLLVVVPSQSSGRKLWGFLDLLEIVPVATGMILQLHDINVNKIVSGTPHGAVAAEAKKSQANWVVLDKHLKHEKKRCMEELQCNIVVMKRSQPKVLRLNLVGSPKKEPDVMAHYLQSKLKY